MGILRLATASRACKFVTAKYRSWVHTGEKWAPRIILLHEQNGKAQRPFAVPYP